ncbi:MAG TPA: hypothetical protein VHY83_15220 [Solirubrobacteraceae bacterium]|jgi:hypothetical protein|nr:hypothetical protein [Solirubrobacteraceae bacterium]
MRFRGAPILAVVLISMALAPSALASGSRDIAATSRYLRANYALVHAAYFRIKQIESRLRGLLVQIRRECPHAAAGAPKADQSGELGTEVIGLLAVSAIHLDIPAGQAFVAAVRALSWRSAPLTRAVRGYAAKASRMISLPIPNICGDVQSWARSGFTALPSFTEPFDTAFTGAWVTPGFLPAGLRRYESANLHPLVRSTEREESAIVELEAREVVTWGDIIDTIGL